MSGTKIIQPGVSVDITQLQNISAKGRAIPVPAPPPDILPGMVWELQTSPAAYQWRAITYGGGLFVAVARSGTGNRIMTSADGVDWTLRSTPADNDWRAITYGNGLFVATSYEGTIMTSPNGINWTLRSSPAALRWLGVTYGSGPGLFVAVASSGGVQRVITSPDGITWTLRTAYSSYNWQAVTYGNGWYVALSTDTTGTAAIMRSNDGINWSLSTPPPPNQNWQSVAYGAGVFASVSDNGTQRAITSPAGLTWTARDIVANQWRGITFAEDIGDGSSLFAAVSISGTGDRVATSPDGVTWTAQESAADLSWLSVAWSPDLKMFAAVGNNSIMTSQEG